MRLSGTNLGTPPGVDLRFQAAQQLTAGTNAIAQAAQLSQQNAFSARSLTGGVAASHLSVEAIAARLKAVLQALVRVAGDHLVWVSKPSVTWNLYRRGGTTLADMIQTAGGLLRQLISLHRGHLDPDRSADKNVAHGASNYRGQAGDFQRVSLQPST
jgi:hypothetical protein